MEQEKLFIVAKIDEVNGKVFLFSRLLKKNEKKFLSNVVPAKYIGGINAWNLEIGDVVGCKKSGSIEIPTPKYLKHVRQYKDKKTLPLNFWQPVRVYPSLKNIIMTTEHDKTYGIGRDGSAVDTSVCRSYMPLPGEDWECLPLRIASENCIVWYPLNRVSKVITLLEKNANDKLVFKVREVSGDVVLSEAEVDPEIISTYKRKGIVRMEYLFPIDKFDTFELSNSELSKEQIASLAGVFVIEKKLTEEEEDDITNYNYIHSDPNAGFYSFLDSEKVDSNAVGRVEA